MSDYYQKYLKYKSKYLEVQKNQKGGAGISQPIKDLVAKVIERIEPNSIVNKTGDVRKKPELVEYINSAITNSGKNLIGGIITNEKEKELEEKNTSRNIEQFNEVAREIGKAVRPVYVYATVGSSSAQGLFPGLTDAVKIEQIKAIPNINLREYGALNSASVSTEELKAKIRAYLTALLQASKIITGSESVDDNWIIVSNAIGHQVKGDKTGPYSINIWEEGSGDLMKDDSPFGKALCEIAKELGIRGYLINRKKKEIKGAHAEESLYEMADRTIAYDWSNKQLVKYVKTDGVVSRGETIQLDSITVTYNSSDADLIKLLG